MRTCIDCGSRRKLFMFAVGSRTCFDCQKKQIENIARPVPKVPVKPVSNHHDSRDFWLAQKAAGMELQPEEM